MSRRGGTLSLLPSGPDEVRCCLLHRTRAHPSGSAVHNHAAGILISLLTYKEVAPPADLAPFVRCIWTLSGESDGTDERILPDGTFELIVHHGTPMASDGTMQPHSMLMGEIRRPVIVRSPGTVNVSGIRFRIGGASAFFDVPMTELRDRIIDVSDARVLRRPVQDRSGRWCARRRG